MKPFQFTGHGNTRKNALDKLAIGVVTSTLWDEAQRWPHGSRPRFSLALEQSAIANEPTYVTVRLTWFNHNGEHIGDQRSWPFGLDIPTLPEMCRETAAFAEKHHELVPAATRERASQV